MFCIKVTRSENLSRSLIIILTIFLIVPSLYADWVTGTVPVGGAPEASCVNPNTNKIYASNINGSDVTVIEEVAIYSSPLSSSITPLADNETLDSIPSFTGNSVNSRSPNNSNIMKVLYQFGTTQGPWEEATITSGGGTTSESWSASALDTLVIGFHSLYVVALDSTAGTINMTENFTGSITPYYFLVKGTVSGINITQNEVNELILSAETINPFGNSAVITYQIPNGEGNQHVVLRVFNIYGGLVKELVNKECVPGTYNVTWNGTNLYGVRVPSGIYFYNLETDLGDISRKSVVVR